MLALTGFKFSVVAAVEVGKFGRFTKVTHNLLLQLSPIETTELIGNSSHELAMDCKWLKNTHFKQAAQNQLSLRQASE